MQRRKQTFRPIGKKFCGPFKALFEQRQNTTKDGQDKVRTFGSAGLAISAPAQSIENMM